MPVAIDSEGGSDHDPLNARSFGGSKNEEAALSSRSDEIVFVLRGHREGKAR